jgi:hypothetical protein
MPDQPHPPLRPSVPAGGAPAHEPGRTSPERVATHADPMLDDAVATLGRRAGPADPALAHLLGLDANGWYVDEILPVDRLMGRRVPASCWAVAVVASGQARPSDTAGTPTHAPAAPVHLAVGVDRTGTVAGRLTAGSVVGTHVPAAGRLLDTMRRCLRLPTPPPPEGTDRLLAVLWLAAALETVRAGRPSAEAPGVPNPGARAPGARASGVCASGVHVPGAAASGACASGVHMPGAAAPGAPDPSALLRWTALLRRHPAVLLLTRRGEHLRLAEMERIVDVAAATLTWDVLRAAETRTGALPLCPPGTAGWMDIGMYARWVLADLPTPDSLWCRLRDRLTAQARREMEGRLTQCRLILPDLSTSRLAS